MKPKHNWFWVRVDGFISLGDSICLIIFGRYWAWSLKFMSWRITKELEQRIAEKRNK